MGAHRYRQFVMSLLGALASCLPTYSAANIACAGLVGYLGVENGGFVTVAVAGSTAIHYICSLDAQGQFPMSPSTCKAAYAALLAARLANKSVTIYYWDNLTCGTLPSWASTSAYFVEGPN
jgi:hypothetical protein